MSEQLRGIGVIAVTAAVCVGVLAWLEHRLTRGQFVAAVVGVAIVFTICRHYLENRR